MHDEFRSALTNDLLSIIEDAILSGGLDALVVERAAALGPCRANRRIALQTGSRREAPREEVRTAEPVPHAQTGTRPDPRTPRIGPGESTL